MNNKIPKTIHYCWFGGNPLPELALKCIESWKKYCPDYEIIEWNEKNFDLTSNTYVKEAYEAKKWAFITDYVRLYAMVNYGGIYMDTDVEVIKPLDQFLVHEAFSGFEDPKNIPTGIMACEKDFTLFKELLSYYDNRHFIKEDGSYDMTTNVVTITNMCLEHGLVLNNQLQTVRGFTLYPNDVFCPKSHETGEINLTENTHTIHHFSGSWISKEERKYAELEKKYVKKYGERTGKRIAALYIFPYNFRNKVKNVGFVKTIGYYANKVLRIR